MSSILEAYEELKTHVNKVVPAVLLGSDGQRTDGHPLPHQEDNTGVKFLIEGYLRQAGWQKMGPRNGNATNARKYTIDCRKKVKDIENIYVDSPDDIVTDDDWIRAMFNLQTAVLKEKFIEAVEEEFLIPWEDITGETNYHYGGGNNTDVAKTNINVDTFDRKALGLDEQPKTAPKQKVLPKDEDKSVDPKTFRKKEEPKPDVKDVDALNKAANGIKDLTDEGSPIEEDVVDIGDPTVSDDGELVVNTGA